MVEPVGSVDELVGDLAVFEFQLAGNGIPLPHGFVTAVMATSQGIKERPVEEGLVEIVSPGFILLLAPAPD